MVKLFQYDHGQKDVVLFELEQGIRIVQQHVGIQDEQLAFGGGQASFLGGFVVDHSQTGLPCGCSRGRRVRPWLGGRTRGGRWSRCWWRSRRVGGAGSEVTS